MSQCDGTARVLQFDSAGTFKTMNEGVLPCQLHAHEKTLRDDNAIDNHLAAT